ncbi:MAG: hypothetical protein PVH63_00635, partial [Balneolaceae bacterium]
MKAKKISLRLFFLLGLMSFITTTSYAQIGDVSSILQAGKEDANTLARAYLQPFGSGFGASLNTGWTNAAKPHKKFGFDLTISSGLAIVPNADKSFDVTQLGLQKLEYENGPQVSQTINGADEPGTTLAAYADPDGPGGLSRQKILEFTMPKGTGFGYVPAPVIKGGIGLIKDTELMFRYMPEYKIGDFGSFKLFGIGA